MDRDYFMNAGIPPPQFDSTTPFPWSGLSSTAEQPFMDPSSSMEQYSHFESPFSSMVSSPPAATSSAMSNDAFVLRELIGKLGTVSAAFQSAASPFAGTSTTSSPLSPPKLNLPILDQISIPNLPPTPSLPSLAADPGFAERAAKFSCFGSRSFNGRTSPFGANNVEMGHRSGNPVKLPRVSSSPALKIGGSSPENRNSTHLPRAQMENSPGNGNLLGSEKKLSRLSGSAATSNEESSVSEQIPSGETGSKTSNEMNSRKRKGVSRGKSKEDNNRSSSAKGIEGDDNGNAKRPKATESRKNETKNDENAANDEIEKQKDNEKPPEAPKDYIHVRARRGQATDSHSLAERVRREKISERMKLLQDLVPGCNKVTGKALMLDEIINYVQSLQRQVEFLSMKLASVNPGLDFNMENLVSKDMFQQNGTLPQQMYPSDSSAPAAAFYNHQPHQNIQQNNNNNNKISSQSSVDPLQLIHSLDGFSENLSQFPSFSEDDLHSIVQMGFVQNSVSFPVQNQTSNMKVER